MSDDIDSTPSKGKNKAVPSPDEQAQFEALANPDSDVSEIRAAIATLHQEGKRERQRARHLEVELMRTRDEVTLLRAAREPAEKEEQKKQREKADKEREEERNLFTGITKWRRWVGYSLTFLSFAGVAGVSTMAAHSLHHLSKLPTDYPIERFWILVSGHSLLVVALVFFIYQVLRAGERLAIPYWWAERNPEVAKMMLGIQDPMRAGEKAVERSVELTAAMLKPLAEVATKVAAAVKKGP